ncbi:MAG TPA: hypothetical protein VFV99_06890 [Kofleriaceae bacterium]|nr:hypothetical protein [Kofleriaceae bacterium]
MNVRVGVPSSRGATAMTTIESIPYTYERLVQARAFRNARCYAPDAVTTLLRGAMSAPDVALIVDVDTLERSALAKIDQVMLLALDALAHAGVHVVLVARYERDRAAMLQARIRGAWCFDPSDGSVIHRLRQWRASAHTIVVTDDLALLAELGSADHGLALGRPELVRENIAALGDTSVRATLWWLLEQRRHGVAA